MTEPKSESIKEIADYLDVKYKIGLLWENFTREKRNDEWYTEMKLYYTSIKEQYNCNMIDENFLSILDNLEFEKHRKSL